MRRGDVVTIASKHIRVLDTVRLSGGVTMALGETAEIGPEALAIIAKDHLPREWAESWFVLAEHVDEDGPRICRSRPKYVAGAAHRTQVAYDLADWVAADRARGAA